MRCGEVRDQFSSYWEKELTSSEMEILKTHIDSCPYCQKDWEEFKKTVQWLHSVEEVEVPEDFLSRIYQKIEGRRKGIDAAGNKTGRFRFPSSLRLPAQAVAMVVTVLLVLYLTRMMPPEFQVMKEVKEKGEPKGEKVFVPEKEGVEEVAKEPSDQVHQMKNAEGPKGLVSKSREGEKILGPRKAGEEGLSKPLLPSGEVAVEAPSPRGMEKAEVSPLGSKSMEKVLTEKGASPSIKPIQMWVVRTSERERTLLQVQELIKRFGGEVIQVEENDLLASLPSEKLQEFERELSEGASLGKMDHRIGQRYVDQRGRDLLGAKGKEMDEKRQELQKSLKDKEEHIPIRIQILQE